MVDSPFFRRQSTITHINEKETDHLTQKMVNYLKSGIKLKHRDVRKSSFWGFDRSKPRTSETLQDMGTVVELGMSHEEQIERARTLARTPSAATAEQGKRLFVGDTCIFNPNSIYRQSWDIVFVMNSLLYTALRVPYAIAFDLDEFRAPDIWFVLNRLIDIVFIMDMVIIMMTAFKDGRKLVSDRKRIACRYLRGWFIFDLAASVPIDLIMWIMTSGQFTDDDGPGQASRSAKLIRVMKFFRTFRILRLIKMKRIAITLEIFLGLNFSVMSIGKYVVIVMLLAHLLSCGFITMSSPDGWMHEIKDYSNERQYTAAMYWAFTVRDMFHLVQLTFWWMFSLNHFAFTLLLHLHCESCRLSLCSQTMTTIGYGDVVALSQRERSYSIFCMIIGGVSFTYAITRIVHIVTSMGNAQKNLAEQLENVKEWASYHEFPDSLVMDIKTYLHYKSSRSYFDEKTVLDGLSVSLKQKVLNLMFETSMKRVELFSKSSKLFLTELMTRMKSEFAAPFSLIICENAVADSMYIIRRGFCAVYKGHEREDVQSAIIMGPGQAFGEIALLADYTTRYVVVLLPYLTAVMI